MTTQEAPPATVKTWTARRRRLVLAHVDELRAALRLADWDVRVNFDDPAEDADASITHHVGQKRATMKFGAGFLALSREDQEQTVVHELMHCHLFGVHDTATEAVKHLPEPARALATALVDVQVETAVDGLADAVAPLLPRLALD